MHIFSLSFLCRFSRDLKKKKIHLDIKSPFFISFLLSHPIFLFLIRVSYANKKCDIEVDVLLIHTFSFLYIIWGDLEKVFLYVALLSLLFVIIFFPFIQIFARFLNVARRYICIFFHFDFLNTFLYLNKCFR